MGTHRYFSWCSYPDIWYARLQHQVIKQLQKSGKKNMSVKFYPNDRYLNPNVEICQKDETINVLSGLLPQILMTNNFDLIISEAWATTFLEILCTNAQIIMLYPKDFICIDPNAMKMITNRVFVADNEAAYLKLIGDALAETSPLTDKKLNDEFLFTYGIGSPTLNSLEKIHNHLRKITHV